DLLNEIPARIFPGPGCIYLAGVPPELLCANSASLCEASWANGRSMCTPNSVFHSWATSNPASRKAACRRIDALAPSPIVAADVSARVVLTGSDEFIQRQPGIICKRLWRWQSSLRLTDCWHGRCRRPALWLRYQRHFWRHPLCAETVSPQFNP